MWLMNGLRLVGMVYKCCDFFEQFSFVTYYLIMVILNGSINGSEGLSFQFYLSCVGSTFKY